MAELRAASLCSGSSGNAYLIEQGSSRVLVDCGLNATSLRRALFELGLTELRPAASTSQAQAKAGSQIQGLLITHEHIDHISGLGVILRRYQIPLYISSASLNAALDKMGEFDYALVNVIQAGQTFTLADFAVTPFAVSHDAADPLGFKLESSQGSVGICTDLGTVGTQQLAVLAGCKLLFFEANYCHQLLEYGAYPRFLKERIKGDKGHLSNTCAGKALGKLLQRGSERIVLCHLSQENNVPALAELEVANCLHEAGARRGQDFVLAVAERSSCSPWHYLR